MTVTVGRHYEVVDQTTDVKMVNSKSAGMRTAGQYALLRNHVFF